MKFTPRANAGTFSPHNCMLMLKEAYVYMFRLLIYVLKVFFFSLVLFSQRCLNLFLRGLSDYFHLRMRRVRLLNPLTMLPRLNLQDELSASTSGKSFS